MSKDTNNVQRRILEINHVLSGVFGQDLKDRANRIMEVRKEVLRKMERKKKHSNMLHD